MEDHSTPTSSGMQVPPAPAVKSQRRGRRRGSTTEGAEGEEDADEDSSSSSSDTDTETSQAQLASFRAQWEEELKKLPVGSGVNSNANSALNLVTSTAASLANPYPNPTSMAGAVSRRTTKEKIKKDQTHHPFASGTVSGQRQIVPESLDDQQQQFSVEVPTSGTVEEQARRWFLQGVGFERHGDLYDAVRCYRKAVQLVPDIEYRISQGLMEESGRSSNNESDDDDDDESSSESDVADYDRENDDKNENVVLLKLFLKQIEQREWAFFQKVIENEKAHLGDLPVEVISYILRWVVSSDLDVRSLDILSSVCKGFYCIARDEKLWQMACERVWSSCVLDSSYACYRDMFLTRPRARIDGCYISKITYIRPGEHSFQDQSYRPWHFVEYFRYIRFFPDGTVHFLTSSDEPSMAIPGLRDNIARNQNTLTGTYEMYGSNIISAVVTSQQTQPKIGFNNNKMKRNETQTQQSTSFHIELQVCSVKGRHNWMLKWVHHAVFIKKTTITNGRNARQQNAPTATITSTSLELSPTKYPPLLFSRVKSFTPKSEYILE